MNHVQPGIIATPVPAQAIHLFFSITQAESLQAALDRLLPLVDGEQLVVGLGASLTRQLGLEVPGLRSFRTSRVVALISPVPLMRCGYGCAEKTAENCCIASYTFSNCWRLRCN